MLLALALAISQSPQSANRSAIDQELSPANERSSPFVQPIAGESGFHGGRLPVELPSAGQTSLTAAPNLFILSASIANSSGQPLTSISAGQPFWLRVDFQYDNATCTPYVIQRIANGWTHEAPAIDWGCGQTLPTQWWHYWGPWYLHRAGTYSASITLDGQNAIAESNENDNAVTFPIQVTGTIRPEWALVNVDAGLALLGDGTDVIVGTMDDALDYTHPLLSGNDSLGRPRLIAELQNNLGPSGAPVNAVHATAVMGIVLSKPFNGGDLQGLAPDARYVCAEFINRAGIPGLPVQDVFDAAGFLVANGVEVINMSWSWWSGTNNDSYNGETSLTNLMADYLSYGRGIVCVPAVNQLTDHVFPTAPGSSRNVITTGGMHADLARAWVSQDHGPTLDGRGKPDLLGNSAENALGLWYEHASGLPMRDGLYGTSFSAPFVTGAVAQMLDFGKHHSLPTRPIVIKAVLMSACRPALDSDSSAWSHTTAQPLDDEQGTGLFDLARVHAIYSAGEQNADTCAVPGFDLARIDANIGVPISGGRQVFYRLGTFTGGDPALVATLAWDRHTFWNDVNSNGAIDAPDNFYTDPADRQDNLDLVLYEDGQEYVASRSLVDNVEHLRTVLTPGHFYELAVVRHNVALTGDGEDYALALDGTGTFSPAIAGASFCNCGTSGCGPAVPDGGCTNSTGQAGRLRAFGYPSVAYDTVALAASGLPASTTCLYIQATQQDNGGNGTPLGDGLLCIGGSVLRLGSVTSVAGNSRFPGPAGPTLSVRGGVPASGATLHYQLWYRNAANYCTPATFNLTNAVTVAWTP